MAAVKDPATEFTAQYMAVYHLHALSRSEPATICSRAVAALETLLLASPHARKHQGYFLLREAADALAAIVACAESARSSEALTALEGVLARTGGHAHRAAAEALGALPFHIRGPELPTRDAEADPGPRVRFGELLRAAGQGITGRPVFRGRSLVARIAGRRRFLVVKLARTGDAPAALARELQWMDLLHRDGYRFPVRFNIPSPLEIGGSFLFRLSDLPVKAPDGSRLHPERLGAAFIADGDYFTYPNEPEFVKSAGFAMFQEAMLQNARLLGMLAGKGIVHTAPIPLFHNRMQQARRRDHGLYEWVRAGRLDRWLASCRFPNLGVSGLRDFEHLDSFRGESRALYRPIGAHFLSLLLVTGSYFRNRCPERLGLEPDGSPVDARDLFDPARLAGMVEGLFHAYYRGFAGELYRGDLPLDTGRLCRRMIDEMGVDRYMEEVLRAADQQAMTDDAFQSFLHSKGFSRARIERITRGEADISILSGPHLGGFNRKISLPELIEAVETMAALCIAGRYGREKEKPA